jgi:hypothetical protein
MLVEDQADFRHLIATLLGRQADLEVVAQLDREIASTRYCCLNPCYRRAVQPAET